MRSSPAKRVPVGAGGRSSRPASAATTWKVPAGWPPTGVEYRGASDRRGSSPQPSARRGSRVIRQRPSRPAGVIAGAFRLPWFQRASVSRLGTRVFHTRGVGSAPTRSTTAPSFNGRTGGSQPPDRGSVPRGATQRLSRYSNQAQPSTTTTMKTITAMIQPMIEHRQVVDEVPLRGSSSGRAAGR